MTLTEALALAVLFAAGLFSLAYGLMLLPAGNIFGGIGMLLVTALCAALTVWIMFRNASGDDRLTAKSADKD